MLLKFLFVYLLIDATCAFFSLLILFQITVDMGTEREVRALRGLVISFVFFLLFDAIWALGYYDFIPMSDAAVGLIEETTMFCIGVTACCCFIYAENRLGAPYVNDRRFVPFAAVPVVIVLVLYVTSVFTGLVFQIGPDGSFTEGPLYMVPALLFMGYLAYTTIHALIALFHERSSTKRREYISIFLFILEPAVCGIIDMIFHGMPVMALSVFSAILLLFMTKQDARINTDALTGLNNRRRAVEYMEDTVANLADDAEFFVFLIDVDYFKSINDTRGHGEGDHALQLIAQGLRSAIDEHHGLAARWGGDEFLIATFLELFEKPEDMEQAIQDKIAAECKKAHTGYLVSVSTGYAQAKRGEPLPDMIAEADRKLYEQKKEHHFTLER